MTHGIYTDFFNKSLPMPTEGPSDADEAAALLGGLTSAEIRRVIFAPRYCPRLESGFDSVGYFVRMRNRVFRSVKSSVPRGIAATLAAEVVMYPGCFNDPEITRLAFGIPRCMICSLPFPIYKRRDIQGYKQTCLPYRHHSDIRRIQQISAFLPGRYHTQAAECSRRGFSVQCPLT